MRTAARLCRDVRREFTDADALAKADRSPVTVADLASQAVIALTLGDAFPTDPLVAEEDAAALRGNRDGSITQSVVRRVRSVLPNVEIDAVLDAIDRGGHGGGGHGRFWTLDPVDGTKGFLRDEQYAVALALVEDGQVRLGVLGCPNLPVDADLLGRATGCLFVAEAGHGAVQAELDGDGERLIQVNEPGLAADARWVASVEPAHSAVDEATQVTERLGIQSAPVRMDSQAKYGAVARGDADIYLRLPTGTGYREKIWDHLAGWLLVTEAGGQVTDAQGRDLDLSHGRTLDGNVGIVATSGGALHARVLDAIAHVSRT